MSVLCILIVPFQVKNGLVILCLCYVYINMCLSKLRTVWSFYVCVMYINCAFPGLERFGHSMSVLCILIVPFQVKNGLVILCLCYVYVCVIILIVPFQVRTVWSFYVCVMYINCAFPS